jgi:tetratricopeptide (TPR) repeat protein
MMKINLTGINKTKIVFKKRIGHDFVRFSIFIFSGCFLFFNFSLFFLYFFFFQGPVYSKVWQLKSVSQKNLLVNAGGLDMINPGQRLWIYRVERGQSPFLIDLAVVSTCFDTSSRARQILKLAGLKVTDKVKRAVYQPERNVDPEYYFKEAEDLFFEGDFERGYEQLLLCLEKKKNHAPALTLASLYLIRQGLFKDALGNLERVKESKESKESVPAGEIRGYAKEDTSINQNTSINQDTYANQNTFINQDTYANQNTSIKPDYYALLNLLLKGICFLEMRMPKEAIQKLDKALDMVPLNSPLNSPLYYPAGSSILRLVWQARAVKILALNSEGYTRYAEYEKSLLHKENSGLKDLEIILKHRGFIKRMAKRYLSEY